MMKENLYEPCHLHQNQYLQIVCQNCQQSCLACPVCIDQYHKGHSMMSLKKFISKQIPKLYNKKPTLQKLTKGIQKVKNQFYQGFQQMRKNIGYQINCLQQRYTSQSQRMKKQVAVICGQGGYNLQIITAIKRKLKNKQSILDEQNLQVQFQKMTNQINFWISQTTESICRTIKDLIQYWDISQATLLNSRKKTQFYFSQNCRHQLIELRNKQQKNKKSQVKQKNELNSTKIQHLIAINKTFDNKYHMAIVEPPLNPFKNQISFKIQHSINNCVWIGICDIEMAKQKQYENCYKKGEGCYWLWQSGGQDQCQFFSSLLDQSVMLDYSFVIGDIISVRVDYTNQQMNKLTFFKTSALSKQKTLIYSAQIEKKQYHACVALGQEFQKVSIFQ